MASINMSSLESFVSGGTDGKQDCNNWNAFRRLRTRLRSLSAFFAGTKRFCFLFAFKKIGKKCFNEKKMFLFTKIYQSKCSSRHYSLFFSLSWDLNWFLYVCMFGIIFLLSLYRYVDFQQQKKQLTKKLINYRLYEYVVVRLTATQIH